MLDLRKLNIFSNKFNEWLAVKLTTIVGSMWCAYAFGALACVSLPEAIKGGVGTTITWIAQTFLQLVLLSVIMVGQKVQSVSQEQRAAQDHQMLIEELALMKQDFKEDSETQDLIKEILNRLPPKA